jgi:hypothetical protein
MERVFGLWLGGARDEDAAALRPWAQDRAQDLRVLPAPMHPDDEPTEDGVHLQAGAVWDVPEVPAGSEQEKALLADFRLVIERAAAFSVGRPFEAAFVYGCCEIGYIEDGQVEPGLASFFADAEHLPVHDHG